MKTTRRVPLKKENSTDNYYKDTLKPRPISFSPKKVTTSQSRIPLPKIPKTKSDNSSIIPENSDQMENEIESRLRLKLQQEYIQRFHSLQNKYDNDISKSSTSINTSFINNLTNLFSSKQQSTFMTKYDHLEVEEEEEELDSYEYEYEYEYEHIDNNIKQKNESESIEINKLKQEIEKQNLKQNSLKKEIERNNHILLEINSNLSESLELQSRLQNEQQTISNQIGEAYIRNSNLFLELNAMKEQKQYEIQFNELPDSFDGINDQVEYKNLDQNILDINHDTPKIGSKVLPTKSNSDPTSITSQNQSYMNSFDNTSQPLINLSYSTDSEEDPMLFYMRQGSKANSTNNIEVDSLDEDSLDDDENKDLNNEDCVNDEDNENSIDTKTEYNWHVEDYVMTDEEVLTYTTKYEEQKQFTLETMMETQEESTTIVETFEMKPSDYLIEEEEEENDDYEENDNIIDDDQKNITGNDKKDDDLNSNELPKELFRSPYRIKIPIRPPKK